MGPILEKNTFYSMIYNFLDGLMERVIPSMSEPLAWLVYMVAGLIMVVVIVNGVMIMSLLFIWGERRLLGRFHHRIGPNRWGPFGLFQPIADGIKVLFKEDIVPNEADRWVFNLAPIVVLSPLLVMVAVIPFGQGTYMVDLNVAVLYVVAAGTVETLGIFMAGWGSGNRYALFGAMRAIAVLLSYEVPLILALLGVIMLAGSMSLIAIVEAQSLPFLLLQPLGFFIFLTASIAEMNRAPFDLVEAESEIIAGFHTEYSGMKFGILQLPDFLSPVIGAGFITALYLKGWVGWGVLPSQGWFLLKLVLVLFLIVWIRATVPRLRIDQVMAFAWKFLFPLSVINILVTAVEVIVLPQPSLAELWLLVGINFVVAIVGIVVMANLLGHRRFRAATPIRPSVTVS